MEILNAQFTIQLTIYFSTLKYIIILISNFITYNIVQQNMFYFFAFNFHEIMHAFKRRRNNQFKIEYHQGKYDEMNFK